MAASETGLRTDGIRIEVLSEREHLAEAVDLQRTIWGFSDLELLPVRLFVVAAKIGGFTIGAFDGNRMIGFCLAIPGIKSGGGSYLHSHMLGVLPEYANRGLGRRMKLFQREEALRHGIHLVEWTFDPLEIKNAYFNIERLGAIVRRYVLNQYGTTSSKLHGGLPTDRCVAEWWIGGRRASLAAQGQPFERPPILERIEVPMEISSLRSTDPRKARLLQKDVSDRFVHLLGQGFAVVGLERTATAGIYLLGEWNED